MSAPRSRGPNNRLICLACRERRIRCELPHDVELPPLGELRQVPTPCYRCRRLSIPCIVRQTTLGRPRPKTFFHNLKIKTADELRSLATADDLQDDEFRNALLDLPHRSKQVHLNPPSTVTTTDMPLLPRQPQSSEAIVIMRAVDTIRCENCEESWPRLLVVRYGWTPALDLSVKAIIAACAYARGVPKLTPDDCYKALARALTAVQITMKQASGPPDDDMLSATALLAPFDGVIKKNDIPMRLHIQGLAAILTARPLDYPVTEVARDIVNFYACDAAVMACVQGTPSPFEGIAPGYYINDSRMTHPYPDRMQLRGLSDELFIRLPRLVTLVHSLRLQSSVQDELLSQALALSDSLLQLQDVEAEGRLVSTAGAKTRLVSTDGVESDSALSSFQFASNLDFEALIGYWQCRLSLLRLDLCLREWKDGHVPSPAPAEIMQIVQSILLSSEYATSLRLRKRRRLFAHAMVVVWEVLRDSPMALGDELCEASTALPTPSLPIPSLPPTCLPTPSLSSQSYPSAALPPSSTLSPPSWPDFVLGMTNKALAAKPPLTATDMDIATEIFAGGNPRGRFAALYGLYQ